VASTQSGLPRNKIVDFWLKYLQLEIVWPFIKMKCDVEIDYASVAWLRYCRIWAVQQGRRSWSG
jgi:hypothetical protein